MTYNCRKELIDEYQIRCCCDVYLLSKLRNKDRSALQPAPYAEVLLDSMIEPPDGPFLCKVRNDNDIEDLQASVSENCNVTDDYTRFNCYFKSGSTGNMYVFISAGHSSDVTFYRWSFSRYVDDCILCIDDPIHIGENGLTPVFNGWFIGTKQCNHQYLATKIIAKISELMEISLEKIIIYGSSSGGTVALHLCSLMKRGDFHPFPVAINPQILPDNNRWTELLFDRSGKLIRNYGVRADTRFHISNLKKGLIIVNAADETDLDQVTKYIKKEVKLGFNKVGSIDLWIYDAFGIPSKSIAHGCQETPSFFLLIDYIIKMRINDIQIDQRLTRILSEIWHELWEIRSNNVLNVVNYLLDSQED